MGLKPEDIENQPCFREMLSVPYSGLIDFVLDYLRRKTALMIFFWSVCIFTLVIVITERYLIAGYFPLRRILWHSMLGLVFFPVLLIPVHELLHVIPFFLTGARKIKVGMDLKQYIFYVTAHRHVATPSQFSFVAMIPFALIDITLLILIFMLPGLWKWSLSLLLFVHTTMCAGDFAMMNFLWINRRKKIYTWDDADQKTAYFYEEL